MAGLSTRSARTCRRFGAERASPYGEDHVDRLAMARRAVLRRGSWPCRAVGDRGVDLLAAVCGTGTLPDAFVALPVCTCGRWAGSQPR